MSSRGTSRPLYSQPVSCRAGRRRRTSVGSSHSMRREADAVAVDDQPVGVAAQAQRRDAAVQPRHQLPSVTSCVEQLRQGGIGTRSSLPRRYAFSGSVEIDCASSRFAEYTARDSARLSLTRLSMRAAPC
jgi:hypothetical protein